MTASRNGCRRCGEENVNADWRPIITLIGCLAALVLLVCLKISTVKPVVVA
ncbi:hypothetical protein [Prochlorococcus sp. MIT 1303]|uniref:hypothetical protein n=1 Tax=Prochlorococcus sp. MIT 1303 TaxID=1723647 RepID=UPI000A92651F|nr:hypothetical protein [Prochlorococcus sp. MIT 1303]